jgi:predicted nuclease of predicted toxin-antitoxin system
MRLLADENIPLPVVEALRECGHDVHWIGESNPGIDDRAVLQRAFNESRILLTFDKDFGTLIFREATDHPVGILLFRLPMLPKEELQAFVMATIEERSDWAGHFAVVEKDRIRMRLLPSS